MRGDRDDIAQVLDDLRMAKVGAVDLHECQGQQGALPARIKPLVPEWVVGGPALTVSLSSLNNLWLHRAISIAEPGQVIVAEPDSPAEAGYWGEIMSAAARVKGVAGLVVDGCVRDRASLIAAALPVFSTGVSIVGTQKEADPVGGIGRRIEIGDASIANGDFIFGDEDGVVVVPAVELADVTRRAIQRKSQEQDILKRIHSGETTLEIYGLSMSDTSDRGLAYNTSSESGITP